MDSDSYEMRIDTGASHCISYDRDDFTGRLTLTKGSIQGYHATEAQSKLYTGTMRFKITDDDDKEHTFEVPNSIYDEQGQHKLLCPQHWSRECINICQAHETTDNQTTTLSWIEKASQRWYHKTVYHKQASAPVPVLHTASDFSKYNAQTTHAAIAFEYVTQTRKEPYKAVQTVKAMSYRPSPGQTTIAAMGLRHASPVFEHTEPRTHRMANRG